MALPALAPPPAVGIERDQITEKLTDRFTVGFLQWLLSLTGRIQASPNLQSPATIAASSSAVGITPLAASISGGSYRLTYYARIITPASVSSSLTVTIGWTDGGIAQSFSFPAITGNTTTTTDSQTRVVRADQATSLTYAIGYASVGGTAMQYDLVIGREALG